MLTLYAIWIVKWWWCWVTEPEPVYLSSFRKLFLFFTNLSAINFVLHFLNVKNFFFFVSQIFWMNQFMCEKFSDLSTISTYVAPQIFSSTCERNFFVWNFCIAKKFTKNFWQFFYAHRQYELIVHAVKIKLI